MSVCANKPQIRNMRVCVWGGEKVQKAQGQTVKCANVKRERTQGNKIE